MSQSFDTIDVLRLEVEDNPTGLVNLVQNPSGELGGWGWVTPVAGSTLIKDSTAGVQRFVYNSPGGVASYYYSEPMPIAAGEYAAASWAASSVGAAYYRARFEWLNSSLTVIGSTTQTGYALGINLTVPYGPYLAPASTAYVRLRFDVYGSNTGTNPTSGQTFRPYQVTVAKAATSGALGSYRANLVANPSFVTDTGGWTADGGVASITRSTAQAFVGTESMLIDANSTTTQGAALSNNIPITGGATYTAQAQVRAVSTTAACRVEIKWFDSTGTQLSSSNGTLVTSSSSGWTLISVTGVAPSDAVNAKVRVRIGMNTDHYVDAVMLEQAATVGSFFSSATPDAGGIDYASASYSPVVTTRTNRLPNPSFETSTTGWSAVSGSLSRVTTQASSGTASALLTGDGSSPIAKLSTATGTSGISVTVGTSYVVQAMIRLGSSIDVNSSSLSIDWYRSNGNYLTTDTVTVNDLPTQTWTSIGQVVAAPANAAFATVTVSTFKRSGIPSAGTNMLWVDAVLLEQASASGTYFDGSVAGSTPDSLTTITRAWTGTAHLSASTETTTVTVPYSTATSSNLAYIEPVSYVDVLGPTHELKVHREALNVGTLEATILDASLDPSQDDLIRPGRRVRLLANSTAGWAPLFTGKVTEASVSYNYKDPRIPDQKRARISLSAVDANAQLSNQKRSEGVATIDELPYVLEGCGVPWSVNGSGNQVPTATVVAINENASALDQIAVTRDSNLGHAWVDKYGVVQVWDDPGSSPQYDTAINDTMATDADLSYSTQNLINEVVIKFWRFNPSTLETEEVAYGPYRNETSIAQWGVRTAEYTIQGLSEETSAIPDYAQAILNANSNPVVTINSLTAAIQNTGQLINLSAALDICGTVQANISTEINYSNLYCTSIDHSITPEKWVVNLGFLPDGAVASPTFVPSPNTGAGGKTIGQLLRPVGEVTMWYGTKANIPSGWLPLDGSTVASMATDYPDLYALLGNTTTLPDFTDKFPIGAGTKALGSIGGAATKTLGLANIPQHTHGGGTFNVASTSSATGAASRVARGTTTNTGDITPISGQSGTGTGLLGTPDPVDILNPFRALFFIIRAR